MHNRSDMKYETIIECVKPAIDANMMSTTSGSEKLPSKSQFIIESFNSIRSRPSSQKTSRKRPRPNKQPRRWTQDQ
jgi:hypothetical protein